MSAGKRLKINLESPDEQSDLAESGIFNEWILLQVFKSIKWDLQSLCATASVNRKLRSTAKRLLWRELCVYRAPRMLAELTNGAPNAPFGDSWLFLAKLMFYCCGCESTRNFKVNQPFAGHFVETSRFSKTSGRSFLAKTCQADLVYVSDPCEHHSRDNEDDLGIYRGVFKGFMKSRTRALLIRRRAELEKRVRCPYCGFRVWSMNSAGLIPKSASRRLGSREGGLEYFVCLNGHLFGTCWLVPLSSDEGGEEAGGVVADAKDDEEDDGENDVDANGDYDGSWRSMSKEVVS
ncbi:EID1-like F-box protein 3 [Euphorbia lathyris]|uniref:EID1-like F-box protein 3 n=1 Tax=Euphorbia lathyris TaxID=212925 RepID=UPI003313975A